MTPMAHEFKFRREVQFSETDMAGIMHFSNYFYFMEEAEHAFFRSLGFSIAADKTFPHLGWPRVKVECSYTQPLRFEDQVEVHLLVREKKPKALRYEFVFRKIESVKRTEVARGSVTVVCVSTSAEGKLKACPIPDAIATKLEPAPDSGA